MPSKITIKPLGKRYYLERCRRAADSLRASWVELLSIYPEYQNECPCWNDFTPAESVELLIHHPEWREKFDLTNFSVHDWWWLILNQEYFIKYCSCWKSFSADERLALLRKYRLPEV